MQELRTLTAGPIKSYDVGTNVGQASA